MESFYKDKFEEVEERRERLEDNDESTPAEEESSTTPDGEAVQEMIEVGSVKVYISSSNKTITLAARNQLQQFFSCSSNTSDCSQDRPELAKYESGTTRFTAPRNQPRVHEDSCELGQEDPVSAEGDC